MNQTKPHVIHLVLKSYHVQEWCGHCKRMDRHFKHVSNHAAEKINNAVMLEAECSKTDGNFCTEMGVKGFPTVVLIFKDKWMKYPSGRTHSAITEFLEDSSKWQFEDLPANIAAFLPVTATDTPTITQGKLSEVIPGIIGDTGEIPDPVVADIPTPVAEDVATPLSEDIPIEVIEDVAPPLTEGHAGPPATKLAESAEHTEL